MPKQIVNISDTIKQFQEKFNTLSTDLGWKGQLTTTEDSDVVGALNEVDYRLDSINSNQINSPHLFIRDSSETSNIIKGGLKVHGQIYGRQAVDLDATLNVEGDVTLNSNITLGNAASDNVIFNADVNSNIIPNTDNTHSLGSSGKEWKNLYLDGTGYIDTLAVHNNADIDGTLNVDGATTLNGHVDLGNATSDNISVVGRVDTNIIPDVDGTYDLGSSTLEWRNLYLDGTAHVDTLDVDANAGIIGTLNVDGATTLNGHVDLGNATSDNISIVGRVDTDIVPDANGTYDLGSSTLEWNNLYLDGTAHVDTLDVDANAGIIGTLNVGDSAQFQDNVSVAQNLHVTGNTTMGGTLVVDGEVTFKAGANSNINLGDGDGDNVVFNAEVNSSIIPNTDNTYSLGSATKEWKDLFIDGTAHIDTLDVDINATVAGTLGVTGATTLNGHVDLGNATGDNISIVGRVDTNIVPDVDNSYDLGSSTLEWRNLYLDGTAHIDTLDVDANAGIIGTLNVTGATSLASTLGVTGATSLADTLGVTGATTLSSTLGVTGATTLNGHVDLGNAASDNISVVGRVDTNIVPKTTNAHDLGSSTLEWKNLYLDGTAHIDTLDVDENAGIIGTLGVTGATSLASTLGVTGATSLASTLGVAGATSLASTLGVTGATSLASTLNVDGATTLNGHVDLGDSTADNISIVGRVDTSIVPDADGTYDLGSSTLEWNNLYLDGTAHVDTLDVDVNATVAGTLGVTGATTLNGHVDLGNGTGDNISISGRVDTNIVPDADNTYDLGSSSLEWRNLYLDGTAHVDTLDVDANAAVTGTLGVTGATTLSDTLGVTGATSLASTLAVSSATTLSDTLGVTGATSLASTLGVTGATSLASTLGVAGIATLSSNSQFPLNITGTHNQKIKLSGSTSPMIEFHEGTDDRMTFGYSSLDFGQWKVWDDDSDVQAISTLRLRSDGTLKISGNNGINEHRIFAEDYHPNADKWTTARNHTVTLTGKVTGTTSQSVDGSGAKTWSIATSVVDASTTNKGIAKYNTDDFTVSSGDVSIKASGVSNTQIANSFINIAADAGTTDQLNLGNTFTIAAGEGINTTVSNNKVTVEGENASTTNKGVAKFNTNDFTVSSGDVSIKSSGVSNTQIANSYWTVADSAGDSCQIDLGDTLHLVGAYRKISVLKGVDDTITFNLDTDVEVDNDLKVGNDATVAGNLLVTGDFVVSGATRTVSHVLKMGEGVSDSSAPSLDGIISFDRGNADSAQLRWNETHDWWEAGTTTNMAHLVREGDAASLSNLTLSGDLTVSGTTTTVNTETINLADNIILLNSNATGTPSENSGIEIERGDSANVDLRFNETSDRWSFTNDGTTYYNIPLSTEYNNYSHPTHPGDDFSVDTGALTGATVVSDIDINVTTDTKGHVTDANGVVQTRTLTLADLGYTGVTDADDYDGWDLFVDSSNKGRISSGENVDFKAGSNVSLDYNTTNNAITINSSYTNTNKLTTWKLQGDTGGTATINHGETVDIAGGTNVTTARSGNTITITATDTNTDTINMGDGFKVANSSGTDQFTVTENEEIRFAGSGDTSVSFDAATQKVTISSTDTNTDTNTTYDLTIPTGTTKLRLDGSDSTDDDIEIAGGTNVTVTRNSANKLTISSTDTNTNTNKLTTFQVEDGDGNEVTISDDKEWKFVEGTEDVAASGNNYININWSDTSGGTDANPYDLSFSHKRTTRTNTTDTDSPAHGGTFDVISGVTSNATGHVTGIETTTVTLPASDGGTDTIDMGDGFKVADSDGTEQFTVTENEDLRFTGTGWTSVSFDETDQMVTVNSPVAVPKAGGTFTGGVGFIDGHIYLSETSATQSYEKFSLIRSNVTGSARPANLFEMDNGASGGTANQMNFKQQSFTPAVGDYILRQTFSSDNSATDHEQRAGIDVKMLNVTNGSEDAQFSFSTGSNGSVVDRFKINNSGVEVTGNMTVTGNVDGRDVSVDGAKLDNIDTNANNYSLPLASTTVRGGIKLTNNTVQSVTANTLHSAPGRTYSIQLQSDQAVVNVPWLDTNELTTFEVQDNDGTGATIAHDKVWKFVEGTDIDVTWDDITHGTSGDPFDLKIKHNDVARTDTTSSTDQYLGGSFTCISTVTTSDTGHVTAANVETVNMPPVHDVTLKIKNSAGTVLKTIWGHSTSDGSGA